MDKINKLSLPVAILIASIVLGGFFYTSQVNKQHSIERQQQTELQAKAEQQAITDQNNAMTALQKADCVIEAQQSAVDLNKDACKRGDYCAKGDGVYLVGQYENAYNTCLQSKGLK